MTAAVARAAPRARGDPRRVTPVGGRSGGGDAAEPRLLDHLERFYSTRSVYPQCR